jgi:LacI family transcriptional regulator
VTNKKVVMQDIADRLNISKNSVSQALSGKDGVSEETRKLIIATAEAMGYRYRKKGQAKRKTRAIGLIASEYAFSTWTFFGEIYLSIEREAQRSDVKLLIQSITPEHRDSLTLPDFIENGELDGLLILSHISNEYINKVLAKGIPTVLIDHHHPSIEADAVLTNNRFGAYNAVRHLIELGHRDIAFIGDISVSPSYQERWEGYLLSLREHGIDPSEERMFTRVPEEERAIGELIGSIRRPPTAWFCVNDGYGYFVCSALLQLGYRIPEDVSVIGFDNSHFSQMSNPKITTMHIDLPLFAHKAFTSLIRRIDHPDEVRQEILLPTRMILRESTGVCRPAAQEQT